MVALDSSYLKTYKATSRYIVILRLLVTGGGHLEFSQFLFSPLGSIYVKKTQLFKIYIQITGRIFATQLRIQYTFYGHFKVFYANIPLFSFLSPR